MAVTIKTAEEGDLTVYRVQIKNSQEDAVGGLNIVVVPPAEGTVVNAMSGYKWLGNGNIEWIKRSATGPGKSWTGEFKVKNAAGLVQVYATWKTRSTGGIAYAEAITE
ncbi:MAG: hypothetical protein HYY30_13215 [Chloroflexi bacterium]|nr:hypothetical protein [Chloroflexota bacterium]